MSEAIRLPPCLRLSLICQSLKNSTWVGSAIFSFRFGSTILRQEGVQCIGDSWKRAWSQMASPKQRIHNDLG